MNQDFDMSVEALLEEADQLLNEAVDDNYKYFLVSDKYLADEGKITPKDGKIKFYPSIKNALMAFNNLNSGRELFVHVPIEGQKIKASKSKEPEAKVTKEIWFKEPTKVSCIGKIRVANSIKTYEYKGGKLTSWNYSWLSSQDANVKTDESDSSEENTIDHNLSKYEDKFSKEREKRFKYEKEEDEDDDIDSIGETVEEFKYPTQKAITELSDALNTYDKLIVFDEAKVNDPILKRYLYKQRLMFRKDVIALYDQVKEENPFIRFTFPELHKYQNRNLFIDTYFYTEIFFQNNQWALRKGLLLFFDFMQRLLKQAELNANGYKRNTIMIPIKYWDTNNDGSVWNYRVSLNPMSIIYWYMYNNNLQAIKKLFGKNDVIFVGTNNYFKINFSNLENSDSKKYANKFKIFLMKICKNEPFDPEDEDTSAEFNDSPEVIKAQIVDKIEDSRGVDITKQVAIATANKKNLGATSSSKAEKGKTEDVPENKENISKLTLNQNNPKKNDNEVKKQNLANKMEEISQRAKDVDDFMNKMEDDEIKKLVLSISPEEDAVDMSAGRASRISELDKKFMDTNIKGRTIRDILSDNSNKEEVKTELKIASPNEQWKNLTYTNFDKNYNIDKDIIACFHHLEHTSHPLSVRDITVEDNSTSEDRVELYKVQLEDYRGKQITVKLDIPTMVDNRFLLRGNYKSIQTQFFNMPIIKTEEGTCQIISNYMKIFLRRFREGNGRSLPKTSQFIKACKKYKGTDLKISFGDNSKICSKYQLPIDYIDLATEISKIDCPKFTIYFNQDEIREKFKIDESKGIPFMYNKKNKLILYYSDSNNDEFINHLIEIILELGYNDFVDSIDVQTVPSTCTFSRASIMNSQIPLIVICAYHIGLQAVLKKANIKYELVKSKEKKLKEENYDFIPFEDGYLAYRISYSSSLLMNGLKECNTRQYKISEMDDRNMYLELLDNYGGRIKADGLDNFYDLMIDPMTKETLEFYHMPTEYIDVLLYANNLLADNKFIKHTDTSSRRIRRYQLIAVYTYKVLSDAYAAYINQIKHTPNAAQFMVKQSAVIDRFLTDSITSDDSVINALRDIETTNSITTKGPSGMNSDRAYSLDKRTYDDSMLNVVALSTGFAGNVGITRQATMNANVTPEGYVKSINGNTEKMNAANTLSATEALTPFGSTHDDPFRTAMTFVQKSKHQVRTVKSDPLLVTNGSDEAMPYLTSNRFAYKAKMKGKIIELTDEYILVEYTDGTKDFVNLIESIEKNSDGGYYVPLKLDAAEKLRVGSIIKENQILAYDKDSFSNSLGETDNIAYNVGKLAKVAVLNTDEAFEDSGIISKKLADNLATRVDQKYDMILDKDTILYDIVKVGDHVEAGHPIMVWQAPFEDEDANSLIRVLSDKEDVSELGKRKLVSEVTGVITAIKIFRTIEVDELSDSLKKLVNNYERPLKQLYKKLKDNKLDTSQVPAHYVLPATGKLKKAQDAILIEIYVEYQDSVGIGDKIVYYSANKAVEKNIFPEGLEPYTDYRPNEKIDAILGETSIMKRMVSSINHIGTINKMVIELDRHVRDILDLPYNDDLINVNV